jgi:hypothetical protein
MMPIKSNAGKKIVFLRTSGAKTFATPEKYG